MSCGARQKRSTRRVWSRLSSVTALAFLGACSDSTGPTQPTGATIRISPAWIDAFGDEPVTLTADVRDRGGSSVEGAEVTWVSLDPDVVTVDSLGTVRGV